MSDTYVLTPREAAEQTGLDLETVVRLANDHAAVATVVGEALRIDPWALSDAFRDKAMKRAA